MLNLYSKNLERKYKYCNVNTFQLINFYNCRIPKEQLSLCKIFFCLKNSSGVTEAMRWVRSHRPREKACPFLFSTPFGKLNTFKMRE